MPVELMADSIIIKHDRINTGITKSILPDNPAIISI